MFGWYYDFVQSHPMPATVYWAVGIFTGISMLVIMLAAYQSDSRPVWKQNPFAARNTQEGFAVAARQFQAAVILTVLPLLACVLWAFITWSAYTYAMPYLICVVAAIAVAIWKVRSSRQKRPVWLDDIDRGIFVS